MGENENRIVLISKTKVEVGGELTYVFLNQTPIHGFIGRAPDRSWVVVNWFTYIP